MAAKIKQTIKVLANHWPLIANQIEHRNQKFKINERSVEYAFVFSQCASLAPRTLLDVGTGTTALPSLLRSCGYLVDAIDNKTDYWPNGMINRHFLVHNEDILVEKQVAKYDMITCISVLEHIEDHLTAVSMMARRLNPGGHICMTFPYTENAYVPNCYDLPGSTYGQDNYYITQSFSRNEVNSWIADNGLVIKEQHYWKFWTGASWTVGERVHPPQQVEKDETHQISCLLLQKTD